MRKTPVDARESIEWGVASLALPGEAQSGDLHLVKPIGGGVLVAVVDGLGHGAEAATAARNAVAALERHATESPAPLIERCHRALRGTRGVVMSVAVLARPERSLTWVGVGNVEGLLLYGDGAARSGAPRESLVTRGGIVGSELPRLHPVVLPIARGDTLIFATDGIREGFAEGLLLEATPQQLADQILTRHGKGTDDALVLVARYLGGTGPRE
ncbi:MAG: stage II sporulation protein E (SpoIIE) [Gemmatimonadetes bacterium]|nr:MAG: stage II sporulation protein E (SpoIIE) [Gemmatimonadota bacterium]